MQLHLDLSDLTFFDLILKFYVILLTSWILIKVSVYCTCWPVCCDFHFIRSLNCHWYEGCSFVGSSFFAYWESVYLTHVQSDSCLWDLILSILTSDESDKLNMMKRSHFTVHVASGD